MGSISKLIRKIEKTKRAFNEQMNNHIKELDKIRSIVKYDAHCQQVAQTWKKSSGEEPVNEQAGLRRLPADKEIQKIKNWLQVWVINKERYDSDFRKLMEKELR